MSMFALQSTDTPTAQAVFLRTLPAIRARCEQVHALAEKGALQYFDYHPAKRNDVIAFCASIIERDFDNAFEAIPPHGRWRHLDAGERRIEPLLATWSTAGVSVTEQCKRLLDLFLVSVLLDAGAGNDWTYTEPSTGRVFARSEGLGVASFHMFCAGAFSGNEEEPCRVDAYGLAHMTPDQIASAFQVGPSNPMVGLEGRTALLVSLSTALKSNPHFFGADARPGNMLDFLETQSVMCHSTRHVHVFALWSVLIDGLSSIWPSRHTLDDIPLGDVWPCPALARCQPGCPDWAAFVPFHKLTSWTAYSLIEPLQKLMGWVVGGIEDMTGLPEYRNGGLLVDFGVLTLRRDVCGSEGDEGTIPRFPPDHPAVVEWRAMTVIELDRIATGLREHFHLSPTQLTLAQVLESATWKGGREIARKRRPATGGPPIEIVSDGTVF